MLQALALDAGRDTHHEDVALQKDNDYGASQVCAPFPPSPLQCFVGV